MLLVTDRGTSKGTTCHLRGAWLGACENHTFRILSNPINDILLGPTGGFLSLGLVLRLWNVRQDPNKKAHNVRTIEVDQRGPKCGIEHEGGTNQITNEAGLHLSKNTPRRLNTPQRSPGMKLTLVGSPSIRMVSSTLVAAAAVRRVPKRSLASGNKPPMTGGIGMGVTNGPKVQSRRKWTSDGNTHKIQNPPEKSFWEPLSDHEPPREVVLRTPLSSER